MFSCPGFPISRLHVPVASCVRVLRFVARTRRALLVATTLLLGVAHLAEAQHISNPTPINLGTQNIGEPITARVTFTVTGGGTLDATPLVLTTGQPNLDFTLVAGDSTCKGAVTPGTCTVNIVFTPKAPGQRFGAVELTTGGGSTVVATALVYGTGSGPAVVFPANTSTITLGHGFFSPQNVAVDGAGDVYVADGGYGSAGTAAVREIVAINGVTSAASNVVTLGSGFHVPNGVAVDGAGNVYVADGGSGEVNEIVAVHGVTSSASAVVTLGSGFYDPTGVAVDGAGNVYVADGGKANGFGAAVKKIVAASGITSSASAVVTLGSSFYFPQCVAVDGSGNVYVADFGGPNGVGAAVKQIIAVSGTTSSTSTVITLGSGISGPACVAVDGSGNVYVADLGDPNGVGAPVKEIVAVSGITSSTSAVITLGSGISSPYGVAMDGAGNVYVADLNKGVLEIPLATPPSLSFASTAVGATSSDSPRVLELQNIGNATLYTAPAMASTNFSVSPAAGLPCGSTLASDGFCNLAVSFQPVSVGSLSGTLDVFYNLLTGTPPTVATLSGTGTQSTKTINFPLPPSQVAGTSYTLTATVSNGDPVTYRITSGPATLAGSVVTYTGTGQVVIAANSASTTNFSAAPTVSDTIDVTAAPPVIVIRNPAPVSFGTQAVGVAQAQRTVTFTITGGGTLDAAPLVLTTGQPNLDYKLGTGSTCTGAVNAGTCTLNVIFTPKSPGQRFGAVELTTGGGKAVVATALVYGTGSGPAVVFPANQSTISLGSGFLSPFGVAVDGAGNVYVADYGDGSAGSAAVKEIVAINGVTSAASKVIHLGSGFSHPSGVAVDGAGNVYIADYGAAVKEIVAVAGVTSSASTVISLGQGLSYANGVAVDGKGNVYVADDEGAVEEIVAVDGVTSSASEVDTLTNIFTEPLGVAVDGAGNVYVADGGDTVVCEIVAANGVTSSASEVVVLGSGFHVPYGVAVDGGGNVYVADGDDIYGAGAAVKEIVAVSGIPFNSRVVTLGSGISGPSGVAVDGAGNVYVAADSVLEIPLATPPSLSFASTAVGATSSDSPRVLELQNIGSADLDTASAMASTNFSLNPAANLPCGTTLASDGFCNLAVRFQPVNAGSLSGTMIVTDNLLTGTTSTLATLSGTGFITPSVMTGPTPGSTLTSSTAAFTWTSAGVSEWQINIGSSPGGHQYQYGSLGPQYSIGYTATGLPTDGRTIYVRLYSRINNAWQSNDYTYTAFAATPVPSAITSPSSGSTLTAATATFQWDSGTNVVQWQINIGKTPGAHQYGSLGPQGTTGYTATGLPTDGSTIYVRLYSRINNAWQYNDYTYTAFDVSAKSAITSPSPATTLTGSTASFHWTAGTDVLEWQINVGSTLGGHQYGSLGHQTTIGYNATGLPTDGSTIYVRLYSHLNSGWQYTDYTYKAFDVSAKSTITSPSPGTTLTGSTASFNWTGGTDVLEWQINVGSTLGGHQYGSLGHQTTIGYNATGLPTDGSTIYVRLYSHLNSGWQYTDFDFIANKP